jgi:hypothetical protein
VIVLNAEKDFDKLKHLLEHWIEHSQEHTMKYKEWAEKVKDKRRDVSHLLLQAVERFEEGEKFLEKAKSILG